MASTAVQVVSNADITAEQERLALIAANDNVKSSLGNLRQALDTASLPEIKALIQKEIVDYTFMKHISLVKDGAPPVVLSETTRHFLFKDILECVHAGIPAALIGPAGSGKSTVSEQIAEALKLSCYLQNSVGGTHELSGYKDAHGNYHGTAFRTAYENGGLLFLDEVDTSDPGALKWLNTAIANGVASFPDKSDPVKRHPDFRIVIAANTFGNGADRLYVGANQLDASTLDRFCFFDFKYDEKLEKVLAGNVAWSDRVQKLRAAAGAEKARVVISPRASIHGARLLAIGWDKQIVEERTIWKGMDVELRKRIEKKAA